MIVHGTQTQMFRHFGLKMYSRIVYSIVFCLISVFGFSQNNIREEVYVHLNSQDLLTGEMLYYSVYVNTAEDGSSSVLSRLAYVEIISPEGDKVYQSKVLLDKGRGHGSFFIPTTVETGSYYLTAYTRWMMNFDDYFRTPLKIYNPFSGYSPPVREEQLSLNIFPEGGKMIDGVESEITYCFTNEFNQVIKGVSGRVLDQTDNLIAELTPSDDGWGQISLIPEPGLKLIIEDLEGNFLFRDFRNPADQGVIISKTNGRSTRLTLKGKMPENWTGKLRIHDNQNIYLEQNISANQTIDIPSDLPNKLLNVVIKDNGEIVASSFLNKQVLDLEEERVLSEFGKRKRVQQELDLPSGSYSISVRKIDDVIGYQTNNPILYRTLQSLKTPVTKNISSVDLTKSLLDKEYRWSSNEFTEFSILPEFRGELISGTLSDSSGPISNREITFSIPGKYFQVKGGRTDNSGRFFITFDTPIGTNDAYIQVLDREVGYDLEQDPKFYDSYEGLSEIPIFLDSIAAEQIVKRSIRNQIENAYYTIQEDSLIEDTNWRPQFSEFEFFYKFDDFTRFPTLEDHFTEYILRARVRRKEGVRRILVPADNQSFAFERDPLVLLDGVTASAESILQFNPYKVENVGIIGGRFYMGPVIRDGIVDIRTYQGRLDEFRPGANTVKLELMGLSKIRTFKCPDYENNEELKNLPDTRDQLFWNPQVKINGEESYKLEFFTSDTQGEFRIEVNGFTSDGEPLLRRLKFTVR